MIRKKSSSGPRSRTSSKSRVSTFKRAGKSTPRKFAKFDVTKGSQATRTKATRPTRLTKGSQATKGTQPIKATKPPRRRIAAPPRDAEPAVPAAALELDAKRRRELRGDAHALEPLVHVGHGGISESVVQAVSRALRDHELIKVRLHEPEDKQGMAAELAKATRSALCGLVGHTVILFRPKPKPKSVSGIARTAIKRNRERRGRR